MIIVNSIKHNGFTIIEAIVSLALFAIAFSGLYLFFGMAQQANNNSEKKMYLNLMANQIIETITAETFREDSDVANPFVTPASYNADLSDCTTFTAPDVRHTWCTELDAVIGPHKGVSADEVRTVEVIQDDTNLIVNVVLVSDSGLGENNLLRTVISRKIPPPRRSTPPIACLENHSTVLEYIKSEKKKCSEGTIPFISVIDDPAMYGGGAEVREYRISCPDYTWMDTGHPSLTPGSSVLSAAEYAQFINMWGYKWQELIGKWSATFDSPTTVYGEGYLWGGMGSIGALAGPGTMDVLDAFPTADDHCVDNPGPANMFLPRLYCADGDDRFKGVNIVSCCPQDTEKKPDGTTYKECNSMPGSWPEGTIGFLADHVTFP
jgi:prepilin-type N-terminal cleavage/methylation domain-containing protein